MLSNIRNLYFAPYEELMAYKEILLLVDEKKRSAKDAYMLEILEKEIQSRIN
jgi:hypothetical protein